MTVRQNRGYTVICVMTLVSAMPLLAVVSSACQRNDRAPQADCMAHLHAIGVAMKLHHADHGRYPGPVAPDPANPELQTGGVTELYLRGCITNPKGLVCWNDSSPLAKATKRGVPKDAKALYSTYNVDEQNRPVYNYYGLDKQGLAVADADHSPVPPDPAMPKPGDDTYPALFNPKAPDETIVTHCTRHREATGQLKLDLILHLGGDVVKERSGSVKWMARW